MGHGTADVACAVACYTAATGGRMLELAVFVSLITWAAVYYSIRAIGQAWVDSAYEDSEF